MFANRIAADCQVTKSDNFIATEVDDELVLMHLANGRFYSLSDTGRRAWELLDEHPRFGDLSHAMRLEYDVAPEVCDTELAAMFGELLERNLIELK